MLGEALVEEGEVRVDQVPERQVFLNQMIKIGLGLEGKEMVQEAVVERIQLEGSFGFGRRITLSITGGKR